MPRIGPFAVESTSDQVAAEGFHWHDSTGENRRNWRVRVYHAADPEWPKWKSGLTDAHAMNVTLLKALVALVPACMLFSGSVVLFFRGKTVCSFLQLLGAGCLVVVVLTHVSEALHLFPWMHWGLEHSVGHYLDFWSAVLGLTLFPLGYLLHALTKRHA
jgi:hypothetical protein